MAKITVYPTKASALNLKHPEDGALRLSGSNWELDGFTSRMISDRAVTVDPNEAWRAPAPEKPAEAPAMSNKSDKPK